jgi:hypothetical protein
MLRLRVPLLQENTFTIRPTDSKAQCVTLWPMRFPSPTVQDEKFTRMYVFLFDCVSRARNHLYFAPRPHIGRLYSTHSRRYDCAPRANNALCRAGALCVCPPQLLQPQVCGPLFYNRL